MIIRQIMCAEETCNALPDSLFQNNKTTIEVAVPTAKGVSFTVPLRKEFMIPPAESAKAERVLVISDIEGEFSALEKILLAAGVMTKKYEWSFGKGQLVIAGDLFDRGKEVAQVLWLLYKLEGEAANAQGSVHVILGNHDLMNLSGDYRYVDAVYAANSRLLGVPYAELYGEHTELGRWLRSKNTIEKIGDLLVMHGGVSPAMLHKNYTMEQINTITRNYYTTPETEIPDSVKMLFMDDGVFWYRGYFTEPRASEAHVDSVLALYNAKRMIVGHTIQPQVTAIYSGKIFGVDVNHHKGQHEGVLIESGDYYRIDDKGKRTPLLR